MIERPSKRKSYDYQSFSFDIRQISYKYDIIVQFQH